jgi:hypothetical protein
MASKKPSLLNTISIKFLAQLPGIREAQDHELALPEIRGSISSSGLNTNVANSTASLKLN